MRILRATKGFPLLAVGGGIFLVVSLLVWPESLLGIGLNETARDLLQNLGTGLTVYGLTSIWSSFLADRKRRQRDDERRLLLDWLASSRDLGRMRIGSMTVEAIRPVAICEQGRSLDTRHEFRIESTTQRRPDPPEWPILESTLLPQLRESARREARQFTDDDGVDLLETRVVGDGGGLPGGRVRYLMVAGAASYYRFAAMSNVLDMDIRPFLGDGPRTLRDRWRLLEPQDFEDLAHIPCPAKIGVGTVVRDHQGTMLLGVRARQWQVGSTVKGNAMSEPSRAAPGRDPLHVVAEGMTPADVDARGLLSPLETARRALWEELALDADDPTTDVSIELTGAFLDTKRWHVVFTTVAQVRGCSLAEVADRATSAIHRQEHRGWRPYSMDPMNGDTRALLLDNDSKRTLASNHAQVSVLCAMLHEHGWERVSAAVS